MRSFKTFLAEVNLGQIADLKPSTQSRRGRLAQKPPSLRRQADDPRQQLSRERQLSLPFDPNDPRYSGRVEPAPGIELLVPGGLTAPARAALKGAASLTGKGVKNLPKAFNFPYNLLPKKYGERTAAKLATFPIAPVGGVAAVEPILDRDVNEYLQSAGYDPEVRVGPGRAALAYAELALKKPRSALSLATSKPAMKQYVGPGLVGVALGGVTRNPLAPIIAGTPPGVAARRAIVDPIATAAGVKDIQTGENPIAQDAARDYTNIIRRIADKQQKQVDATKSMIRARKEGMRQSMNPYYNPNRKKSEISTSAF